MLSIALNHLQFWGVGWGLSMNLELTDLARLAIHQALASSCSHFASAGITGSYHGASCPMCVCVGNRTQVLMLEQQAP